MYFPYLRGRQFELLALKELVSKDLLSKNILPIIEPIKLSSTLINTLEEFVNKNKKIGIIVNPIVGNFWYSFKSEQENSYLADLFECLILERQVIKTVLLIKGFEDSIVRLEKNKIKKTDLITIAMDKDTLSDYEKMFESDINLYTLTPENRSFTRKLMRFNKVIFEDCFNKQEKNSDYSNIPDEPFSENHYYYAEEGFDGFGDYSIIGSEYKERGFAPSAIAIHIVYFANSKELRIKHFVSSSNDGIGNPALKYYEAVTELHNWVEKNDVEHQITQGLKTFLRHYEEQSYSGLGMVKKLSLMHHLELMGKYLDNKQFML